MIYAVGSFFWTLGAAALSTWLSRRMGDMGVNWRLWVPVLAAALPLLSLRRAWLWVVSSVLLVGFCVLGAMTVGIFYFPGALAMVVGTFARREPDSQP